jgi:hypothetical protein
MRIFNVHDCKEMKFYTKALLAFIKAVIVEEINYEYGETDFFSLITAVERVNIG